MVFLMSRQNTTFWPKVGEMGAGKTGSHNGPAKGIPKTVVQPGCISSPDTKGTYEWGVAYELGGPDQSGGMPAPRKICLLRFILSQNETTALSWMNEVMLPQARACSAILQGLSVSVVLPWVVGTDSSVEVQVSLPCQCCTGMVYSASVTVVLLTSSSLASTANWPDLAQLRHCPKMHAGGG